MKAKDVAIVALGFLVLLFIFVFIDEREKNKRKDALLAKLSKENAQLKQGYLTLLEKYLQKEAKVAPDILEELHKLKQTIDSLETNVHYELDSVIRLMNAGEGTKAIKDLTKIIENKLKEKVIHENVQPKGSTLNDLLDFAGKCNWLNSKQVATGHLLREIRNKESHELAVNESHARIGMAIFGGIDIIYELSLNKI